MASKEIMAYEITKILFRLHQSALMQQRHICLIGEQNLSVFPRLGFAQPLPMDLPIHLRNSTIQLDALISKYKHCTVCLPSDKATGLMTALSPREGNALAQAQASK